MPQPENRGLTGLLDSRTAILCANCFDLPGTTCGTCNLIRALLLLPLRITGAALLLVLSGLGTGSRSAVEVQLMATKSRDGARKWLAIAAASAAAIMLPGPAAAAWPFGLAGIVAPQIFAGGASVPVIAIPVIAVAAAYGTYKIGEAVYKAAKGDD